MPITHADVVVDDIDVVNALKYNADHIIGDLIPDSAGDHHIGSASKEWLDLFIADAGVLYFGSDQEVTLTHVHNVGLLLNAAMRLEFRDAAVYVSSKNDGYLDLDADTGIRLNGAVSAITTLSMNNQLTNSLAVGTAPFVITSTTKVANLNVEQVDGYDLDQALLQASSPSFAGLHITGASIAVGSGVHGLRFGSSADDNFWLTTYTNTVNPNWGIGYGNGAGAIDASLENIGSNAGTISINHANVSIPNGNITLSGTVDGRDISADINQAVLTTSSPTHYAMTLGTAFGTFVNGHEALNIARTSSANDSAFIEFSNGVAFSILFGEKPNSDSVFLTRFDGGTYTDFFSVDTSGNVTVLGDFTLGTANKIKMSPAHDWYLWYDVTPNALKIGLSGEEMLIYPDGDVTVHNDLTVTGQFYVPNLATSDDLDDLAVIRGIRDVNGMVDPLSLPARFRSREGYLNYGALTGLLLGVIKQLDLRGVFN